jgi:hypothetical protein
MKLFILLFVSCGVLYSSQQPIPLDPEATGLEYRAYFIRHPELLRKRHALDVAVKFGKRFLDWLIYVNDHRPKGQKISLSHKTTQPGFPIESPGENNPTLVLERLDNLKKQLPTWMLEVIENKKSFTEDVVDEAAFITWGLKVDRMYQSACRWLLEEPYLSQYTQRASEDIRGYYFLSRRPDLKKETKNWTSLSTSTQQELKGWFVLLCKQFEYLSSGCSKKIETLIKTPEKLYDYYLKYQSSGQKKFNAFFELKNPRRDIEWSSSHSKTAYIPFIDPKNKAIQEFLASNIEDEWKWNNWNLILRFVSSGSNTAFMEFVPGSTPHVDDLGANKITMDANAPLTEYDVQWTIRHEFGHVLGFPDCYIEFYDTASAKMINYQIDITNLMCSRQGHLQQKHYDQMSKYYYKP